jgi:sulfoxide reductase heme-binding subunit YedZ
MIRRLGASRWKNLHMLVYPAAILAVFHFFMMVKADIREPLIYAAVLTVLLGYRLVARMKRRSSRTVRRAPKTQAA